MLWNSTILSFAAPHWQSVSSLNIQLALEIKRSSLRESGHCVWTLARNQGDARTSAKHLHTTYDGQAMETQRWCNFWRNRADQSSSQLEQDPVNDAFASFQVNRQTVIADQKCTALIVPVRACFSAMTSQGCFSAYNWDVIVHVLLDPQ